MDVLDPFPLLDSTRSPASWTVEALDWIGVAANIGSLAGFVVTMYTLYKVRQLRRHYTYMARAPELQERLTVQTNDLFEEYLDPKLEHGERIHFEEAVTLVKRATSTLDGLTEKMAREHRREMTMLREEIAACVSGSTVTTSDLWNAYGILSRTVERAEDIRESTTWTLTP